MPDNAERVPNAPDSNNQPFPITLTDFSRLDQKLFSAPGDNKPANPSTAFPAVDGPNKPLDLRQSIYPNPFRPPSDSAPRPGLPVPAIGDATKPANLPPQFFPPPFPISPADTKPKPIDQTPVKPIVIPPIGDTTAKPDKPTDKPDTLKPGPDGKFEITEKDFDKIGPKAKQVLTDAGVTKLTITPGQGFDTYEATFKKPLEIAQDPNVDGTRKLKIAEHFKADVKKGADGSFSLENIEGLTAESKILFQFREAQVTKIHLKQSADGKSEITSTGEWNGISGNKTRIQPAEVFDKANYLFSRMAQLRGGELEIPPLPGR